MNGVLPHSTEYLPTYLPSKHVTPLLQSAAVNGEGERGPGQGVRGTILFHTVVYLSLWICPSDSFAYIVHKLLDRPRRTGQKVLCN